MMLLFVPSAKELPDYNPYIQALLRGINQAKEEFAPFNLDISIKMLVTLEPAELVNLLTDMSSDSAALLQI